MGSRSGVSFTLTLVVAGMILLITAAAILLGGTPILQDFFGTVGEGIRDEASGLDGQGGDGSGSGTTGDGTTVPSGNGNQQDDGNQQQEGDGNGEQTDPCADATVTISGAGNKIQGDVQTFTLSVSPSQCGGSISWILQRNNGGFTVVADISSEKMTCRFCRAGDYLVTGKAGDLENGGSFDVTSAQGVETSDTVCTSGETIDQSCGG